MLNDSGVPIIPRKHLFENPAYLNPRISPDGRWLSWIAAVDGVMNVWIAPSDDLTQARPLTRQTERPIFEHWIARTNAHVLYRRDAAGEEDFHVWCVAIEGGEPCDLTPYAETMAYIAGFHYDDPYLVAIAMNDRDARWHDLYIVDIRTGERQLAFKNLDEIAYFLLDSHLGLRLASSTRGKGRGSAILKWNGIAFVEILSIEADDAMLTAPYHMTRTGDAWFMGSSIGRDTCAIIRVDWETGAETVIASHPQADISDGIADPRTGELTAVSVNYIRPEWIAIDGAAGRDLATLGQTFDATIGVESQSDDDRFWIIAASRPDRPVVWHLLDRTTGKLSKLFESRPKLADVKLAAMHGFVVKARDGLELVCYLTLPATETGQRPARPLPMVLQVHGGPWWRDSWFFNRQLQWYANRGYGVLQVNYRGSTGVGKAFINAGDREWAGKMHDDLIDVVNWAIVEGIADPKRIAICGGSYGGYGILRWRDFHPRCLLLQRPGGRDYQSRNDAGQPAALLGFVLRAGMPPHRRSADRRGPRPVEGAIAFAPRGRYHQTDVDRSRCQRCALQSRGGGPDCRCDAGERYSGHLCCVSE